jgi:hypothetical protein
MNMIPSSGVISMNNYIVLINPQDPSEAGDYILTLGVFDGLTLVSRVFTVSIPNSPPTFNRTYDNFNLPINSNVTFDFPATTTDDDGNPITYMIAIEKT